MDVFYPNAIRHLSAKRRIGREQSERFFTYREVRARAISLPFPTAQFSNRVLVAVPIAAGMMLYNEGIFSTDWNCQTVESA